MQRKHIVTASLAALAVFLFVCTNFISLVTWRSVLHESPGVMGPYQAPLLSCDEPEVIPQYYMVFLHIGYSLDTHKERLKDTLDLDSAIETIFEETPAHGLYYYAKLEDTALAAVRADVGVDMVECDRRFGIPGDFSY